VLVVPLSLKLPHACVVGCRHAAHQFQRLLPFPSHAALTNETPHHTSFPILSPFPLSLPSFALPSPSPHPQPSTDVTRWFTLVGVVCAFISTFFADAFLRLARRALDQGRAVSKTFLLQNLVRNININLVGLGITIIGLQASGEPVLSVSPPSLSVWALLSPAKTQVLLGRNCGFYLTAS
jgi:hypothetical protein